MAPGGTVTYLLQMFYLSLEVQLYLLNLYYKLLARNVKFYIQAIFVEQGVQIFALLAITINLVGMNTSHWVILYQVCSNVHAPVMFGFFNELFCSFLAQLKHLMVCCLSIRRQFTFFDIFKTAGQILFNLSGDVQWVGHYQLCSLGGAVVIF